MFRILVPVDFSDNSNHALQFAAEFTKQRPSSLLLLNVFDVEPPTGTLPFNLYAAELEKLRKESERRLKKLALETHEKTGISCSILSKQGPLPAETIAHTAREENIALIIAGSKGHSNNPDITMGRTTESLVESASCPVLAVPYDYDRSSIRNIAIATNFSQEDLEVVREAIRHIPPFKELLLIHAGDEKGNHDLFNRAVSEITGHKVQTIFLEKNKDLGQEFDHFVTNYHIDMLVVHLIHHNLIRQLFRRGAGRQMAFHSRVPVLYLH